jgi:hypothetical protein
MAFVVPRGIEILQIGRNRRTRAASADALIRPNAAGFGPTNGPTASSSPGSRSRSSSPAPATTSPRRLQDAEGQAGHGQPAPDRQQGPPEGPGGRLHGPLRQDGAELAAPKTTPPSARGQRAAHGRRGRARRPPGARRPRGLRAAPTQSRLARKEPDLGSAGFDSTPVRARAPARWPAVRGPAGGRSRGRRARRRVRLRRRPRTRPGTRP